MNRVWIYSIVFFYESDEYPHLIYQGSFNEVFDTRESAERWKKDFEDPKNIEYVCDCYNWYSRCQFESKIDHKEILKY